MGKPEDYIMKQEYNNKNLMSREKYFNETGHYGSDEEILLREQQIEASSPKRGDGGATSYYSLPKNATELKHLIRHKNMGHAVGEAFCALYRLNDNGEYKRNLTKALYYIQSELDWVVNNADGEEL